MSLSSKFFDRIRIARPGQPKPASTGLGPCQWKGCENDATHRAPMGRKREGEFFRFCFEHVTLYNRTYNYFSGLDDDTVARFQKDALTGHRPTWGLGVNRAGEAPPDFGPAATGSARIRARMTGQSAAGRQVRKPRPLEQKALDDLGLPHSANPETVKARYKELVKRHHPDANGGDRSTEDRLRRIIQAYKVLKQAGLC
jgi:curved DNA-binding protein CbpA